eukprot:m.122155 g.122155  ORF g.122155 m.122155 type:complete len:774 (-) comp16218_c1_seq2:130-2451(-)
MTSMDDIRALQEELQRAQRSGSLVRLSERNCVQLVQKLLDMGLIELLYTTDGKQYLTPAQLEREVQDELVVQRGRVNLVDLQQTLNVDLVHIENAVGRIVKHDGNLHLVQGELLSAKYLDGVAEEVNDILQENGQISVPDLCSRFGLPVAFLQQQVEQRVGRIVHGQLDVDERDLLYTSAYVARQTARVRGVMSGVTRPTPLAALQQRFEFHGRLFMKAVQELIASKRLAGVLHGRGEKAVFVPDLQSRTQDRWIQAFYRENHYIEYDAVSRLGLSDPKGYLQSRIKGGLACPTCYVSMELVEKLNAEVEEALTSNTWLELLSVLPSPFTSADALAVLHRTPIWKTMGAKAHVFRDAYVCSPQLLNSCLEMFKDEIEKRAAANAALLPKAVQPQPGAAGAAAPPAAAAGGAGDDDDDDDDGGKGKKKGKGRRGPKASAAAAPAPASGATGGKKGGGAGAGASGRGAGESAAFMQQSEIVAQLRKSMSDCPDELLEDFADTLAKPLNDSYQAALRNVFLQSETKSRKVFDELQEDFRSTFTNTRLFLAGLEQFSEEPVPLHKHLLKTLGTDLINIMIRLQAEEHMAKYDATEEFTPSTRAEILKQLPSKTTQLFTDLTQLLSGKSAAPFLEAVESAAGALQLYLRKADKKADRQILFNHRHSLLQLLAAETRPAAVLHLIVSLLFQKATGCMVSAPGKCVPLLVSFLEGKVAPAVHTRLVNAQTRVMALLRRDDADSASAGGAGAGAGAEEADSSLQADMEELKKLVTAKADEE